MLALKVYLKDKDIGVTAYTLRIYHQWYIKHILKMLPKDQNTKLQNYLAEHMIGA